MMNTQRLKKGIQEKTTKIAIMGLGYVGLSNAISLVNVGFNVIGYDINEKIVNMILKGRSNINEPKFNTYLKRAIKGNKLIVTLDRNNALSNGGVIIITVQTPINNNYEPDLSYLKVVLDYLTKQILRDKLLIIESTIPPGTSEYEIIPHLERNTGLKCGTDFLYAYCPERVLPGNLLHEIKQNPRIIGGINSKSSELAEELFKTFVQAKIIQTTTMNAEIAKLAENTFRDVNIAFANELAMICTYIGADYREVIEIANKHPRVNIHRPGVGVGGPCLTKDPYLLLFSFKKEMPCKYSRLISVSRAINEQMPLYVLDIIKNSLMEVNKVISEATITIMGVAYKGGISDVRNSPSEKIINLLLESGSTVRVYDPHTTENFRAKSYEDVTESYKKSDCIVIATNHSNFLKLDFKNIKCNMKESPIIVDLFRMLNKIELQKLGFIYKP